MSTVEGGINDWVGGFFDAEGSVGVNVGKRDDLNIGYEIRPIMRVTQSYIGGFIDGDGSVTVDVSENESWSVGYQIQASALSWHNIDPAIEALEEYSKGLDIDYTISDVGDDAVQFQVSNIDDVEIFLSSIRDNVISKKPQVEIMLDEIVPLVKSKSYSSKLGFLKIMEAKERMDSYKDGKRGKYTLEYFEDEWGISVRDQKGVGDW